MSGFRLETLLTIHVPLGMLAVALVLSSHGLLSARKAVEHATAQLHAQTEGVATVVVTETKASVARTVAELAAAPSLIAAANDEAAKSVLSRAYLSVARGPDLLFMERAGRVVVDVGFPTPDAGALARQLAESEAAPGQWVVAASDERLAVGVSEALLDPATGRVVGRVHGALLLGPGSSALLESLREATGARSVTVLPRGGAGPASTHVFELRVAGTEVVRLAVALDDASLQTLRRAFAESVLLLLLAVTLTTVLAVLALRRAILPSLRALVGFAERARAGEADARFEPVAVSELSEVGATLAVTVDAVRGEQRRAEEHLATFESLVRAAAHEMRSPVVSIGGRMGLLVDEAESDPAAVLEAAEAVERAASRLDRMLTGLRFVAEAGRAPEEQVPVDLAAIVAERCPDGVRLELPSERPHCLGDPKRLTVAVQEILRNVAEHASRGEGCTLRLSGQVEEGLVRYRFTDDGPGLDAAGCTRALSPFWRGVGTAPEAGGVGIGLAVARRVAAVSRGSLTLESEEGQGLTVVLSLPSAA